MDKAFEMDQADCCDGCEKEGIKLYHRWMDGDLWVCKECAKETDAELRDLDNLG